jgi:hypothetical protein
VRPEEYKGKIALISGIEPATFQLVTQCLYMAEVGDVISVLL